MEFELRRPSADLAESFSDMRDAVMADGYDGWIAPSFQVAHRDVPGYIAVTQDWSNGRNLPEDWVPSTTFWILIDGSVVGELHVRHRLNEHLEQIGGHIGYVTHPAYRRRGVATFALRQGLKHLAEIGVGEALVTCLDTNIPSVKVIEKCGGKRIADANRGPARRRYRFELCTPPRPPEH